MLASRPGLAALALAVPLVVSGVSLAQQTPVVPADGAPSAPAPAASAPAAPDSVLKSVTRSDGTPKLTLQGAVQRAVATNTNAQLAQIEVQRSEALLREVKSTYMPLLTGNVVYTHLDAERTQGAAIIANQNQLSANLLLTVPIFAPKAWLTSRRAEDAVEVARAGVGDIRRQVAVAVGHAFLAVIAQRRIIEADEQARDTARAHLEFARARLTGGVGNRLDEVRAQQELAVAESQLQNAVIGLVKAREAVTVLLASDEPIEVSDEVSFGDGPTPTFEEARSRRLDLRLLDQRVQTAERALHDDWADYAPSLLGYAQPFYQTPATLTQPRFGWQVQLALSIPIFDGGLRGGLSAERQAIAASARESAVGAVRQVRSDLRVAQETVSRAESAAVAARESARLAQTSVELATIAYKGGASTNLEVIDAERRARDAATAAAVADDAVRQAKFDQLVAGGRFP
jgi:outer membrane protein TolC